MRGALSATLLCACGSAAPARTPSNTTAAEAGKPIERPTTLERECWLGDDYCVIELDLDSDGRADRMETVRAAPCVPPETDDEMEDEIVDPPCAQGLWITLASGITHQVGAGLALPPQPSTDQDFEPIPLDADLGGLRSLGISQRQSPGFILWSTSKQVPAPCDGDGIILTGEDAAAVLCWVGGTAAAYHLGF